MRWRKSQQGSHDLPAFCTMWSGDDQGLSDLRTILSFSRNSAFAAASFSASRRQKRAAMGGPVILMWCSTSDPTGGRTFDAQTTFSNSSKNSFTHCGDGSGGASAAAATPARAAEGGEILLYTWAPRRQWLAKERACCPAGLPRRALLKKERPCCPVDCPAGCACRGGGRRGHRCKSLQ